jgi:hypothetical protein
VSAPDDVPVTLSEKMNILTPEILAQIWNIGLATAKRAMHVTTQAGLRNVFMPGERQLRAKCLKQHK